MKGATCDRETATKLFAHSGTTFCETQRRPVRDIREARRHICGQLSVSAKKLATLVK